MKKIIKLSTSDQYQNKYELKDATAFYNESDLKIKTPNYVDIADIFMELVEAGKASLKSQKDGQFIEEIEKEIYEDDFQQRFRYYLLDGTCIIDFKTISITP